jgi:hypothetical protein
MERVVDFDPATMTRATLADGVRMWERLSGALMPDEVRGMINIYAANNADGEDELLDLTQEW